MEYRRLGKSDVQISAVTLGAWAIGGLFWGGTEEKDAIDAIRESIDRGVTSIDTAPVYGAGRSERLVGRAIAGRRERVQLLTKFGMRWDSTDGAFYFEIADADGTSYRIHKCASARSVIEECEASLKRLGTDHIDLLQHHTMAPQVPIEETFGAVARLIKDGKVRAAGVSNYTPEAMERVRAVVALASNQPPYSMVQRKIEADVLPYCRTQGIGVIVYSPLQMGLLTGKATPERKFPAGDIRGASPYFSVENRRRVAAFLASIRPIAEAHGATLAQLVINWTLRRGGVTAALVGARNPAQARENAAALDFTLSDGELKTINEKVNALKLEV